MALQGTSRKGTFRISLKSWCKRINTMNQLNLVSLLNQLREFESDYPLSNTNVMAVMIGLVLDKIEKDNV